VVGRSGQANLQAAVDALKENTEILTGQRPNTTAGVYTKEQSDARYAPFAGFEAWTPYSPVVTAATGTLTAYTATGLYNQVGKTVFVEINITITTNGTGAGSIHVTLPFTSNGAFLIPGRENATTGKMLQGVTVNAAVDSITNYDNTYPAGNGAVLILTGVYEST
jgi:hypothetical protein